MTVEKYIVLPVGSYIVTYTPPKPFAGCNGFTERIFGVVTRNPTYIHIARRVEAWGADRIGSTEGRICYGPDKGGPNQRASGGIELGQKTAVFATVGRRAGQSSCSPPP